MFINIPLIKRNFLEPIPIWTRVAFSQLISYGVHIGHSCLNTLNFCAWMLKGRRKGIFLIDLFKFIYMFRGGLFALDGAIRGRNPIWFINLEKTASLFVKYPALECGEYWVIENWIRGMISNYRVIRKSFRKTMNTPFAGWNRKFYLKNANFMNWGFTRNTWPRLIFVSNVYHSYGPCHEAHKLQITSLGITDTNTPHKLVAIAIPGNDESASSLIFYNCLVSNFILYLKFTFIHNWYLNCFYETRFTFEKWWYNYPSRYNPIVRPNVLLFNFDQLKYMISGFEAQFLQDIWQVRLDEGLLNSIKIKNPLKIDKFTILRHYKKRLHFFQNLASIWTTYAFAQRAFKRGFRRWFIGGNMRKFFKKSFIRPRNFYLFVAARWFSKRRFLRRIFRRLFRSNQSAGARASFFKFFGIIGLSSFLRYNYLFSERFGKLAAPELFFTKGSTRTPWYRYTKEWLRLLPPNLRRFYVKSIVHSYSINFTLLRKKIFNNKKNRKYFLYFHKKYRWWFNRRYHRSWENYEKTVNHLLRYSGYGAPEILNQTPREWANKLYFNMLLIGMGMKISAPIYWDKKIGNISKISRFFRSSLLVNELKPIILLPKHVNFMLPCSVFKDKVYRSYRNLIEVKKKNEKLSNAMTNEEIEQNPYTKVLIIKRRKKFFKIGSSVSRALSSLKHYHFFYTSNYKFYKLPKIYKLNKFYGFLNRRVLRLRGRLHFKRRKSRHLRRKLKWAPRGLVGGINIIKNKIRIYYYSYA